MMDMEEFAIVGLGKMGKPMAYRAVEKGFHVYGTDVDRSIKDEVEAEGVSFLNSPDLIPKYMTTRPRRVLLEVPEIKVDDALDNIVPVLEPDDIVIDGGNCDFRYSKARAEVLFDHYGVHFVDMGVSGGPSAAANGARLYIGGLEDPVKQCDYIFKALAKDGTCYKHYGPSGVGHLIKGFHNLPEYGDLQGKAEGLVAVNVVAENILGISLNLADVAEGWNEGAVLESRLMGDMEKALRYNPGLEGIGGEVHGQTHGEMRKLMELAESYGADMPVARAAIEGRECTWGNPTKVGKIINATRNKFGGHDVREKK